MKAHTISVDLTERLSQAHWNPRGLLPAQYPCFIHRLPRQNLLYVAASGDLLVPQDYELPDQEVTAVAGLSVFRFDIQDLASGKPVNLDNYVIVQNEYRRDIYAAYISLAPFKNPQNHHLPDIPENCYEFPFLS